MTRSSGRARASTPGVHISNQTSSSSAKHIKPSSSTRIKIANNPAEKSQKSAKKEAEGLSVYQNRQQSRGEDLLDRKKSSVCSNHNEGSVLDQAGSNEVDLVMGFYNNQAQQGGALKESSSSVTTNNVASQMIEAILTDHNSPDRNPIRDSKELHKTENSSSEVVAGNVGEDLEDHQKYQNDLIDIEPICDDESELTVISTLKTPITKSNNGGPLGTGVEPRGGSRQESLLFKRAENQGSAIATPQPKNSSLTQSKKFRLNLFKFKKSGALSLSHSKFFKIRSYFQKKFNFSLFSNSLNSQIFSRWRQQRTQRIQDSLRRRPQHGDPANPIPKD